jgi:DNA-directed RNA polymerase specialized sigma24 family protein
MGVQSRSPARNRFVQPLDVEATTREYFPRIHRAALVMCGNPWDADDLAQETFLVLARQGGDFQGRSSVYTWLYGIMLNLERRERRRCGLKRRKLRKRVRGLAWRSCLTDSGSRSSCGSAKGCVTKKLPRCWAAR